VQIAAFKQFLAKSNRGVVSVRQERVLDDDGRAATSLYRLDEMLKEQERGFAGLYREILLDLRALLAPERRIGQDNVEAVLLLNVVDILGKRVGVENIWRLDAVQDHVHDRYDVGEALLLLAEECFLLEGLQVLGRQVRLGAQVIIGLAKEAS
jgi:hypothetical protein